MDFKVPKMEKKSESVEEKIENEKPKTSFSSSDLKMDFPLPKPKKKEEPESNVVMSLPEQKKEMDTKPRAMSMSDLLSTSSFKPEKIGEQSTTSPIENVEEKVNSRSMEPVKENPKDSTEAIIHQEQIPAKEIDVTDDQFFDDFFDD